MRVEYKIGWQKYKSEWVCFEHDGYARHRAVQWWQRRSPDPVPDTAEDAVAIASNGGVALTTAISVRNVAGEPYDRIVSYELGAMPDVIPVSEDTGLQLEEIPF
jgi:DNA repair protein RadD